MIYIDLETIYGMVLTMTMVMLSSCLASSQKYSHRTGQNDKDTNNNDSQVIEEKYRSVKYKQNDLEAKAQNSIKSKSEKAGHSNVGSYNTYQSSASTSAQHKCYGTFCTNNAPFSLGHTMFESNCAPKCCVPNPNMPLQNLLKHVDTCFESNIEGLSKLLQSRSIIVLDSIKNHLDAVNRQLQKHIDTHNDQLISSIENMRTISSSAVLDRVIKVVKTLNKANINDVNALSKKVNERVTGIVMQTASQPAALLISTAKDLNTKNGLLLQLLRVLNSMGSDVGQVVYMNTEKMLPELNSILGIENAVVEKQVLSIIHAQNETLRLQIHLANDKKLKMVEKEVKSFLDELSLSFTGLLTDTGYTISRFVEQACNGQLPIAKKKSRRRRDKSTTDLTQGNVPLPFTPNV